MYPRRPVDSRVKAQAANSKGAMTLAARLPPALGAAAAAACTSSACQTPPSFLEEPELEEGVPNRKTHQKVGMTAGAAFAAYHARGETFGDALVEIAGGGCAGWLAGALPDVLEPAYRNPRHRSVCHSSVVLVTTAMAVLEREREQFRARAHQAHDARQIATNLADALILLLIELVYRFLAGTLAGLQAGYVSHLVLDARTRASLPLLCRGF